MKRGATPTCIFHTNVDLSDATVIYVTFRQGRTKVEHSIKDIEVTSEQIAVTLSQAETLRFAEDGGLIKMQVRAKFADGKAVVSNIVETEVEELLKEGEI